jgi:hypothetical protein
MCTEVARRTENDSRGEANGKHTKADGGDGRVSTTRNKT